ncbi:T9SS type A sorting domain-containing protein [Flavobacterium sp. GT3R68]|uniref:T9SS type A sorting domain-containing protein n=1 Tax=Flavobacterium sp. GT3R68 TaxID=2594437 RepID=UPI000F89AFE0|nr:T9SS type A sorting domain-containing protein [Flavobacterium sp. GT3R68]RTY92236.1 T9SS type A sorting domain-containing protein [Flavobacterium sp. GSN2]TRW92472.1 T9SS type A sorting domain-containing protein [Flavobacterium sp. GT3R68]
MKYNYIIKHLVLKGNILTLLLLFIFIKSNAQNDYSVVPIPHQIYSASVPIQGTADDKYSAVIQLPFDFDFFGNLYNQAVVSTNGFIDFRTNLAAANSPWSFNGSIPSTTFPVKNSILGSFHDLDNSNAQGTLTYGVVGSAPYRKFVVIFNNHSHYSCTTPKSSFQMVLYETFNLIDIQIIKKELCPTWNAGKAVSGIINSTGSIAFTPPNRNTGAWTALQEGWRYKRPVDANKYFYTKCDSNSDGFESFNLQIAQNDLSVGNPAAVSFYATLSDAQSQTNAISAINYTNSVTSLQTIYANNSGQIKEVVLRVLNCNNDFDLDSVATNAEDLNGDGNFANDDTDNDGIPNFADNDDDGDMVLTEVEYVFSSGKNSKNTSAYLDTDGDTILNYLDKDDDGDGVLTINEDYNGNNNPIDDDTNSNGIKDYLDANVALGTDNWESEPGVSIYPNPASDLIFIENHTAKAIKKVSFYNVNGQLVKTLSSDKEVQNYSISDLQSGIYFVKIQLEDKIINTKLIKK